MIIFFSGFFRRVAAFHKGCVAKGRRRASEVERTRRASLQEGVCPRIATAPLLPFFFWQMSQGAVEAGGQGFRAPNWKGAKATR